MRCSQHHHGECRDVDKVNAYKHGKTRRYDAISISVFTGVFKLILALTGSGSACINAENVIFVAPLTK